MTTSRPSATAAAAGSAQPPVAEPPGPSRRRGWSWARREIAQLDPARDDERIVRLMNEVRFGWPPIAAAFYTVAFARQVAVPSIAYILHRGGRSPVFTQSRKRNDDTLVFFAEFFHHGHSSARGREAVDRMQEIHGHFPITQEDSLYTLSTIITEGPRAGALVGTQPLSWVEREANATFWSGIGAHMGLPGLPWSYADALDYALTYEREHWGHTTAGQAVARAVIEDYIARWVPERLRSRAFTAFCVLLGPELRAVHRFPEPSPLQERLVLGALRGYLRLVDLLPDRRARTLTHAFGDYGMCPHLPDVGYHPPQASAVAADSGDDAR